MAEAPAPARAEQLDRRIRLAHARFAELAREVPPELTVGGWTARLVVVHVATVINRYTEFDPSRLADQVRGVDEINQREIDQFEQLGLASMEQVLERLDDEMRGFHAMWGPGSGMPLDMTLAFHGGASVDVRGALCNVIGEFLIHGLDIAAAAERPWVIDDEDGQLLCGLTAQVSPAYVRRSNTRAARIRIEARGMPAFVLDVRGPTAEVAWTDDGTRAGDDDVVVKGRAGLLALLFYGRTTFTDLIDLGAEVRQAIAPPLAGLSELFEQP